MNDFSSVTFLSDIGMRQKTVPLILFNYNAFYKKKEIVFCYYLCLSARFHPIFCD